MPSATQVAVPSNRHVLLRGAAGWVAVIERIALPGDARRGRCMDGCSPFIASAFPQVCSVLSEQLHVAAATLVQLHVAAAVWVQPRVVALVSEQLRAVAAVVEQLRAVALISVQLRALAALLERSLCGSYSHPLAVSLRRLCSCVHLSHRGLSVWR